jgi:hypothetical protein
MDLESLQRGAPPIPGDTCPTIDQIKTRLEAVDFDLALIRDSIAKSRLKDRESIVDDLLNVDRTLAGISLRFEELRTDNRQLRESSRYWYLAAKQLSKRNEG